MRRISLALAAITASLAMGCLAYGLALLSSRDPLRFRSGAGMLVAAVVLGLFAFVTFMEARGRRALIRRGPSRRSDGTPHYSVDLRLTTPIETVIEAIQKRIRQPNSAVAGYVDAEKLELWVIPQGANSFIPSMLGRLERTADGTRIIAWFPPRRPYGCIFSLWLAGIAAFGLFASGLSIAHGKLWNLLIVIPGAAMMAGFGLIARYVGREMSRGDEAYLGEALESWFPETSNQKTEEPENGPIP